MLFDSDDLGLDYNILNLANLNEEDIVDNSSVSLVSEKEGFLRGNMFKDEYVPYKNLTYFDIKPVSERDAKLLNIMNHEFVINDLNLYLDIHPEDKRILEIMEKEINNVKNLKSEYVRMYGPLEVCDTYGESFKWIRNPWPWEDNDDNGGSMYV